MRNPAPMVALLCASCGNTAPPRPETGTRPADPAPLPPMAVPSAQSTPVPAAAAPAGVIAVNGIAGFDALSAAQAEALRGRRVFWGHQSVGANLIEGARSLGFEMTEVGGAADWDREGVRWGEAGVAENGDPERKLASFVELVGERGIGRRVEAAGFKLCWVDFETDTDVGDLLDDYETRMRRLAERFPRVRFLHVTPPLTTDEPEKNSVRWRFGREMISRLGQRALVFDLAAVISTGPDGRPCRTGSTPRLCGVWASDNGHLDEDGSRRAAKAFLYAFFRLLS